MVSNQYVLVIDTGTSSMRGLLIDSIGSIVALHRISYSMTIIGDSATQDAADFSDALCEICSTITKEHPDSEISAIALTSQRSSVIPVDEKGVPLDQFMMWYDKRAQYISDNVNSQHGDIVYQICGMVSSPVYSAPKIRWFRENRSDVYSNAYKFIGIHDYLIHYMTGQFCTDPTLASRSHLMDVTNGTWSDKMLGLYGIEESKLCKIIPVGTQAGKVHFAFSSKTGIPVNTPVITAGGDQQCSALGLGLLASGEIGITAGTGGYVVALSDSPIFDSKKRVHLCQSVIPGKWLIEASCPAIGTAFTWSKGILLGDDVSDQEMDALILEAPQANGVIVLAELNGKGCPQWDSNRRGIFLNVGLDTTKADLARATFEGIISSIADCYAPLREFLPEDNRVLTTGGLSKAKLFNQIFADMINSDVLQSKNEETTGIGAWMQAVVALGVYPNLPDALGSVDTKFIRYMPEYDNHLIYKKIDEVRHYVRNQISFTRINSLNDKGDSHENV